MGTTRFTNRQKFLEQLEASTELGTAALEATRLQLAIFPPAQLICYWFTKRNNPWQWDPEQVALRQGINRRSVLFEWVYGAEHSVARDLLYVRLPSAEKRRLVSLLLLQARPRLPWLDARTVHAMAFRPSAFGAKSQSLVSEGEPRVQWGPLYHRIGIPKGNGKRVLTIPNPALMQVQRALLGLLGPSLETSLGRNIYGTRRGVSGPTFQNAEAHIGQAYIASFDLKDFFPSVRVADIIVGLQAVRDKGILMVDPERLPEELRKSQQCRALKWTDDAMVLVARLCTHRSRLPQGAPLSPLLASVAFARFDDWIVRRLLKEFGTGGFQYTRYFDDITVSLSRAAAHRLNMQSTAEALRQIESCLKGVLEGSSFTLNPAKSRCACLLKRTPAANRPIQQPVAEVTGLVVRPNGVSIPRDTKRWIRETVHRLSGRGFVEVARDWSSRNGRQPPDWMSVSRGHRWKQTPSFRRQCSAERLAVLMLQRMNPDLRIRVLHKDWYAWQDRLRDGVEERSGAAARPPIQWLLAAHWRGQTSVRAVSSNQVIFSHDGQDICAIQAESALEYLNLTSAEAIAAADYWHHLNGMLAYLKGCPKGDVFKDVHAWADRLADAARDVTFKGTKSPPRGRSSEVDSFEWFGEEAFDKATREVESRYWDYRAADGIPANPVLTRVQGAFRTRATDEHSYSDWLSATSQLFVRTLPNLPLTTPAKSALTGEQIFEYLRVKEDIALKRVHGDHCCVETVETKLGLRIEGIPIAGRVFSAQRLILEYLAETLRAHSSAKASTMRNEWHLSLEQQLMNVLDGLGAVLQEVRSTAGEKRLLDRSSGSELGRQRELLLRVPDRDHFTSDECWRHLFSCAKVLLDVTREVVELDLASHSRDRGNGKGPMVQELRAQVWNALLKDVRSRNGRESESSLRLLVDLRNRSAHPEVPDRRKEWVGIMQKVAKELNRSWKSEVDQEHNQFRAECDLKLTSYEVASVTLILMKALVAALELARDGEVWKQWRESADDKS